jgi:hypothetical protein
MTINGYLIIKGFTSSIGKTFYQGDRISLDCLGKEDFKKFKDHLRPVDFVVLGD